MRTEETTLNNKVNKQPCAAMAYSSFCVDASAIIKVSRLPLWARNWLVEQKDYTADLDFDNFGVSFCIVADSLLQQPFRGQIDCREPSHSHRY